MSVKLKPYLIKEGFEAGCDEAGRGCLAGPVFAAAVVLPLGCRLPGLNDSKLLKEADRLRLRSLIEKKAISWSVVPVYPDKIDEINILWASVLAMQRAVDGLNLIPDRLLIDGNRFKPFKNFEYHCIIKGDSKYKSIAAASILAKTYRDDYMKNLALKYPEYGWGQNKGYASKVHRDALGEVGITEHHRLSFRLDYSDMNG